MVSLPAKPSNTLLAASPINVSLPAPPTTVIPFAAQHRGMQLRKVVQDYHEAATPKAVIDKVGALINARLIGPWK